MCAGRGCSSAWSWCATARRWNLPPKKPSFVVNRMRDLGVLLGTDGPHHNVIKIRGPMPFDKQDADCLVAVFARVLEEDFSHA